MQRVFYYLILIEILHSFNLLCFYNSYGYWLHTNCLALLDSNFNFSAL